MTFRTRPDQPERLRLSDLEAYLDEALPVQQMAQIERALREDTELADQLAQIIARRDAGVHSLGEIWRRHRLSCPSRERLGTHLLGALPDDHAAYLRFHLETVGCRWCQANLEDLQKQRSEAPEVVENRRRKYYHSSAGYLKR